jgi:membrane protein implicated in regulation of membrane protease activity
MYWRGIQVWLVVAAFAVIFGTVIGTIYGPWWVIVIGAAALAVLVGVEIKVVLNRRKQTPSIDS